jgi:hypothetical protein
MSNLSPSRNNFDVMDNTALQQFCLSVLESAFPEFENTGIEARFYPYIGLTHTIRRRGSSWRIRISDHCRHASATVLEAITLILACKVLRRRPPRKYLYAYDCFRKESSITEAVKARRLDRGKKRISGHPGNCHSLPDIYREINERYFNGQVEIERIGWGLRKSWGRLGHYDPVHHTITLSPVLDSASVPLFVVKFIVYHELLHAVFNGTPVSGNRRYHSPEFRRAERAYPDFERARKFLGVYCGRRKS